MPLSRARMIGRYLRYRLQKVRPYEVQAVITNRCNRHCAYCSCPDNAGEELSNADWLQVINRLRELGNMRIKFQGGEPTIRKDFRELTRHAQSLGIITASITNGSIIASRPGLLDHLDELVVSLDSPLQSGHDPNRGQGSHRQALQALELGQRQGKKVLVNMVVNRNNYGHLSDMLAFCKDHRYWFNAQPMVAGKIYYSTRNKELTLSLSETQEMNLRLAAWKDKGEPVMFSALSYRHAAGWPDYNDLRREGGKTGACIAGREYYHLEPNGDVYPCANLVGHFEAQNLREHGLKQAMAHAAGHTCQECWIPYLNERRALSALRPGAVMAFLGRNRA